MYNTAPQKKRFGNGGGHKSRCRYAEYKELLAFYVNAVIASEDRNSFGHNGIDVFAICRAVLHDIKVKAPEQGGSTIYGITLSSAQTSSAFLGGGRVY